MSAWMKLEPTRHQVAIAGVVSDAQTGQVIHGAEVKIERGSTDFERWLNLKEMQYRDRFRATGDRPDRKSVQLNPSLSLIIEGTTQLPHLLTYTALDGHFYFLDLPAGVYTLVVSLPAAGTRYGTVRVNDLEVAQDSNADTLKRGIADIALPPTTIKGRVIDAQASTETRKVGVVMARVQVEGSQEVTFSDRNGEYLLTGLEVCQKPSNQPSASPKPVIKVSAQGYQSLSAGVWLSQGEVKDLDFSLTRT